VVVTQVVTPRENLQVLASPPFASVASSTLSALDAVTSLDALARGSEVVNAAGAVGALQAPASIAAMAIIVSCLRMSAPPHRQRLRLRSTRSAGVFHEGQSACPEWWRPLLLHHLRRCDRSIHLR
jgi:hypothetical protein